MTKISLGFMQVPITINETVANQVEVKYGITGIVVRKQDVETITYRKTGITGKLEFIGCGTRLGQLNIPHRNRDLALRGLVEYFGSTVVTG